MTKPLIRKKKKIIVRSSEKSASKFKKSRINALNSGLAPPIKMEVQKAVDYWNQGPLIYEDPN